MGSCVAFFISGKEGLCGKKGWPSSVIDTYAVLCGRDDSFIWLKM